MAALGVVGVTSFVPNSFTMGLITAVQKRVATGSARCEDVNRAMSAGFVLALLLAVPFAAVYFFYSRQIAGLYVHGKAADMASAFLRLFCFSFAFASANQAIIGFWIGMMKSRIRLVITIITTGVNVAGNLILIPRFGFEGVAIASAAAIATGFLINLGLLVIMEGYRWVTPTWREINEDARVVLGVSMHQLSLALTLNSAAFVVGLIGTDALAIASVIGTLSLPTLYLGIGYGTATGTFLVKALEGCDHAGARAIARRSLVQVFTVCLGIAGVILLGSLMIRRFLFWRRRRCV
ncbi:MAG: hypothetical protein HC902_00115 [Calothrix sp. SM1_5_4]|nr:hypothetical protein [Calothrix sp. SM1_5_4]